MNNKIMTNKHSCPTCGNPAQAPTTTETCLRLPQSEQVGLDAMLAHCAQPDLFQAFSLHNVGSDPCIDCEHNQVSHDPGTFIEMKQFGEKRWAEIHECPNCRTQYEFLTG